LATVRFFYPGLPGALNVLKGIQMVDRLKILAIAVALAVAISASALVITADPLSKKPGADGGQGGSGAGGGCDGSDGGQEGRGDSCDGYQQPCPAPDPDPCPEPDACDEPGTTLSVLAAI